MSLEAKFAALSMGDESSIVEAIKADGIVKSGFCDNIEALKAKAESSDEAEALAGLATVKAIAEGVPEAEAINKECLTACKFHNLFDFTPGNRDWIRRSESGPVQPMNFVIIVCTCYMVEHPTCLVRQREASRPSFRVHCCQSTVAGL